MPKPWAFYGRRAEIHALDRFVNHRAGFSSLVIYGRRNVGKTALLRHFAHTVYCPVRGDDPRTIILCSLQQPQDDPPPFLENLRSAIARTNPMLLEDYTPHGVHDHEHPFVDLARHVLEKGHVLVLDEFQRIRWNDGDFLAGNFQALIDDFRIPGPARPADWHPRLILMGSEQQRLVTMFKNPRAPMFNRVDDFLHVQPWNFSELREMTCDQGWDRNPNRLLTLWTAYNGLPEPWRRLHNDADLSDFSRISDDTDWTRRFLDWEEHRRISPGEGFQDQMEVQLRPSDQAIVRWLAEKPEGRNLATDLTAPANRAAFQAIRSALQKDDPEAILSTPADVRTHVEDAIRRRLSAAHLGLLRERAPLDSEDTIKWSVADNAARFELQGLEPFAQARGADKIAQQVLATERMSALQHLEGYGLEQFAARALHHLFDVGTDHLPEGQAGRTWLYTRCTRTDVSGDLDILLIHHKAHPTSPKNYDGVRDFWIGSAKRSAQAFTAIQTQPQDGSSTTLQKDIARIPSFLTPLSVGSALTQTHFSKQWRGRVHYVVIARSFTDAEKALVSQTIADAFAVLPDHGIDAVYSLDIADMMSGRGPQPLPLPTLTPDHTAARTAKNAAHNPQSLNHKSLIRNSH